MKSLSPFAPGVFMLGAAVGPVAFGEEPLPFPNMAPTIGAILAEDYYDPDRIRPVTMVSRGLRSLENAEVALEASWQDGQIRLDLGGEVVSVPAPEPASLGDAMEILERVRDVLDRPEFSDSTRRNLVYATMAGALQSLDPHTVIMPPLPASEFTEDIAGEFFGIGAYLNQEDGVIRIERVMPGLPAENAGIEDGDIIVRVDGEPTTGLSLGQTVQRIKGPKGTEVVLTVERDSSDVPIDIAIVRDRVEIVTMVSWFRDGIGYVRMDDFNRNTARQLVKTVGELQDQHDLKGFVLDLRFNGGGLLKQARLISDFFLPHSKEIVRTVAIGQEPQISLSGRYALLQGVPMVCLVSGGSASAAEILSGALQINDRAIVAGVTTYGKGSVQTVRRLRDQSHLKFTIQEYQLAGGVSIQERGVTPDLQLNRHTVDEQGVPDVVPYTLSREADNEFALHAADLYEHPVSLDIGWVQEWESDDELREHRISSRNFQPDQEAMLVIDLLGDAMSAEGAEASVGVAWLEERLRQETIDLLRPAVAERAQREDDELAQHLVAAGLVDVWGGAEAIDPTAIDLAFTGPRQVMAGEETELRFRIENTGDIEAGRLVGVVVADDGSPLWEAEFAIGAVPARASVERSLSVSIPQRLYQGEERLSIELNQVGRPDEVLAKLPVSLEVSALPRPHLSYSWEVLEIDRDVAAPILYDRPVRLRMTVRNDGSGASRPLDAFVFKDDDPFVRLDSGRFELPAIEAGASATFELTLTMASMPPPGMSKRRPGDQISLQFRAEERFELGEDGRYRAGLFHVLELPVGPAATGPLAGQNLTQPSIELVDITKGEPAGRATVRVRVTDDNPSYLLVYEGQDKTALVPLGDEAVAGDIYRVEIGLDGGLNQARIVVHDADDINAGLPLRLWGEDPLVAESPVVGEAEAQP